MKKILLTMLVAVGLMTTNSYAASQSKYGASGAANSLLVTGACTSYTFTFINTNENLNSSVVFYDAPALTNSFQLSAYTNVTYGVGSITNIYTNYFGVIQTNTYTGAVTTTNTIARTTNLYPIAFSVIAVSNAATTATFNYNFLRGILFTNGASVLVSVTYTQ